VSRLIYKLQNDPDRGQSRHVTHFYAMLSSAVQLGND